MLFSRRFSYQILVYLLSSFLYSSSLLNLTNPFSNFSKDPINIHKFVRATKAVDEEYGSCGVENVKLFGGDLGKFTDSWENYKDDLDMKIEMKH